MPPGAVRGAESRGGGEKCLQELREVLQPKLHSDKDAYNRASALRTSCQQNGSNFLKNDHEHVIVHHHPFFFFLSLQTSPNLLSDGQSLAKAFVIPCGMGTTVQDSVRASEAKTRKDAQHRARV